MSLVDLHRHLDGSLRPSTVAERASELGLEVPKDLCFTPGMGLMEALSRFEFTLALLQSTESVARVADEMCLDARLEGIDTLEIRFAPQLHTGSTMAQIVDAALEGVHHRAGLILCGLYGEPPSILEALVDIAHRRDGVVGIDLAGGPAPQARYGISDYVPAFTRARALGLGRTVHAGEGRPVDEIRFAVDHLHAQRIGHGVTLLDDDALVDRVIERGITIEACPTSNWQTGIIDSVGSHPIKAWIDRGIRVNINTDNTLLSQVSLPEELARTADACGLSDGELAFTLECGHQAAFGR